MDANNKWDEELALLKSVIDRTGLTETTKWGASVYTRNGKNIVSVGGFKNYFTLVFFNGVFIEDKHKVFVGEEESKAKAMRQWRFTSKDEINEKLILAYIREAVKNEDEGKKLIPEKFKPVAVSGLLADELKKDEKLKSAFEKLTPGKQKEYNLYVDEAKQEATKLKRIEKIKPMIMHGVGLNDKYKNC